MSHYTMNYETLQRLIRAISMSKDPEEVVLMTVEGITSALGVKGCVLFLLNDKTNEFEIAAAYGLSKTYLEKGPLSALRSIAQSPEDGPVDDQIRLGSDGLKYFPFPLQCPFQTEVPRGQRVRAAGGGVSAQQDLV